jgi:pyruvate formate-lyase/glycerol dehydratase family glycyl radical enzyme
VRDRVRRLRARVTEAVPSVCPERAVLITRYCSEHMDWEAPVPLQRAGAFRYLMEHRTLYLGDDELIVGEKGRRPGAAPTYPELCCHSLDDLSALDSREKVPFAVSQGTMELYGDVVIPFWKGRSMRDRVFGAVSPAWKDCYGAGVFTEFMEQRSPGHTVLDGKIYTAGMREFTRDVGLARSAVSPGDPLAASKLLELDAMDACARALVLLGRRYAARALELASAADDPVRRAELEEIAEVCGHVPEFAPRTFREAVQYYWFVHLGVTTELNPWDAFSPGRLDSHLLPFYRRDLEEGRITAADAEELLQCLWIKFAGQPAPPKTGITALESGTYNDFVQIGLGGLTPEGSDAVNELTYMILDVVEDMRLIQPGASVQVSSQSPDEFLLRAARIVRTGFGQPSFFNCDMIVEELVRQGKTLADARQGGSSGCVEAGAFGKENYNLSGYLNLPKILEITLHDGVDPATGNRIGLTTGDPVFFTTTGELVEAFSRQLRHFVDVKVEGNAVIEDLYRTFMPAPFLSLLISDCIENAADYHAGGARYNTTYIQGVGIGSLTDMFSAMKHLVFDTGVITMERLLDILDGDFDGAEVERQMLSNRVPRYGNDDDRADGLMLKLFGAFYESVEGRANGRGGEYHIDMLPTTVHVFFGSVTGATPDGRRAGTPLSEGISPVQGTDLKGPTAVLLSAAKMDHSLTGGTLLNQKFTPAILESEESLGKFVSMIRTYFRLGGHHVQFNVVDRDTLLRARSDPGSYRGLIVRVAGYSDYFCDLSAALQDEIIARTGHGSG